MPVELEDYREEADRFLTALEEEAYLHFSGQKERLELEPIHDRYADLTTLSACRELADAGSPELWRFACEGYLGRLTAGETERIAELETTLQTEVAGEEIGFRLLGPALANEPDRARRERLEGARVELGEQLEPVYQEALEKVREGARELAGGTYRDLYERFGLRLGALDEQCRRFLEETEDLYVAAFDRLLSRRLGIRLEEAKRFDVPRLLRADTWDDGFPAARMLPALEATLADLGIDLRSQRNVLLDVEWRPTKHPRAFCAPIEVPGRVVLCIQPIGGIDDWRALFHETGHLEHFAHTSAHLPLEARRLGDYAVSECWAFLLEGLVTDPAWLTRRLDFGRPGDLCGEWAAIRLYFVRRYCGKLLYELELHGGANLDGMADRYVDWMREATKIEFPQVDFLDDVDPGFYVTRYLRAWAAEAQLSEFLGEQHGSGWFTSRGAGSLLRELWSEGQGLDADELLGEVTGAALELGALADDIRSLIR